MDLDIDFDGFINTNFLPYFQYKEELYGMNDLSVKLRLSFNGLELFLNEDCIIRTNHKSKYGYITFNGINFKLRQFYKKLLV